MSEEEKPENEAPKVFSITGEPYQSPEELKIKPCAETLSCLKDVLEHAEANEIRGVFVLGWSHKHKRFVRWCMMPSDEDEISAAIRFLGGIEVGKSDLLAIATDRMVAVDEDGNPIE